MNKPKISIIAAFTENRVLGKGNKLLWHIGEDFKRFKKITLGHPVIMGRKTYESMGKLLPGRLNIIITRDPAYAVEGAVIVATLEDALNKARETDREEIFIIGGGQIFTQAIPNADKLYLTIIHSHMEGDTYFPDYSAFKKKVFEQDSESEGYKYTFLELERQ